MLGVSCQVGRTRIPKRLAQCEEGNGWRTRLSLASSREWLGWDVRVGEPLHQKVRRAGGWLADPELSVNFSPLKLENLQRRMISR
jgi:hypothetical protein